jgi:hypothetical protein
MKKRNKSQMQSESDPDRYDTALFGYHYQTLACFAKFQDEGETVGESLGTIAYRERATATDIWLCGCGFIEGVGWKGQDEVEDKSNSAFRVWRWRERAGTAKKSH